MTFVTGTDEHGEKIAEAAKARGMQPKDHCDSVVEEYKSLWTQVAFCCILNSLLYVFYPNTPICKLRNSVSVCFLQLDISYDSFIRTTDKKHEVGALLCKMLSSRSRIVQLLCMSLAHQHCLLFECFVEAVAWFHLKFHFSLRRTVLCTQQHSCRLTT